MVERVNAVNYARKRVIVFQSRLVELAVVREKRSEQYFLEKKKNYAGPF